MSFLAENKIRLGYGAAFFLLLIAFSYSVYTTEQLLFHIRWVSNTNKVLHDLEGLMLEVKDLDANFQDISRSKTNIKTADLEAFYRNHFSSIDSICNILQDEVDGEYVATVRMAYITNHIRELRNEIIPKIENNTFTTNGVIGLSDNAKGLLQEIETKITDMHVAEKALLNLRSERLNNSTGSMKGINIIILVIALLLAGYSWFSYYNENTAKNKARSQIDAYAEELEKKVTQLTKANSELIQLRSLQKFTSTGRIARMIAHEVRNPLTNINLSYDQLKDLADGNEQANVLLETIMRNSNRINQLVSELLNATKEQELKFSKVSINKLLDETLEIARDRIQLEHIVVKKNYSSDICDVDVDADKIKIAFLNIIINAVEAMPRGGGLLTLRTESMNNKCVVKIIDNGFGMDKDTIDKIFDPYFTGKPKGNGLGLTNTQNIILNHKGSVKADSNVGQGTTFTVELDFTK